MTAEATQKRQHEKDDGLSGFARLDDRGRVALSKATREALNLHAGSSVAYVVVDGTVLLIPQDEHWRTSPSMPHERWKRPV